MADQSIAPVAAPQAASISAPAQAAAKAPTASTAPIKAEPPKTEASGTVGQTSPNTGVGTKVNYYA